MSASPATIGRTFWLTTRYDSKSELKKRIKQREQEEKKAAKAAAQPAKEKPEKKASAEEEEGELTPNVCLGITRDCIYEIDKV